MSEDGSEASNDLEKQQLKEELSVAVRPFDGSSALISRVPKMRLTLFSPLTKHRAPLRPMRRILNFRSLIIPFFALARHLSTAPSTAIAGTRTGESRR